MTNCEHFFGRVVTSDEGIPYDYEKGCLAGCDIRDCGTHCKMFKSLPPTTYTITTNNEEIIYVRPNSYADYVRNKR